MQGSLFDSPGTIPGPPLRRPGRLDSAPEPVPSIHARAEAEHAEFLDRIRRILRSMFAGTGQEISTDWAWWVMERYGIQLPPGASSNVLGSLFSGWDRATAAGWERSKREGANGNLLRTWVIV